MKKSTFTEAQILGIVKERESGLGVTDPVLIHFEDIAPLL